MCSLKGKGTKEIYTDWQTHCVQDAVRSWWVGEPETLPDWSTGGKIVVRYCAVVRLRHHTPTWRPLVRRTVNDALSEFTSRLNCLAMSSPASSDPKPLRPSTICVGLS